MSMFSCSYWSSPNRNLRRFFVMLSFVCCRWDSPISHRAEYLSGLMASQLFNPLPCSKH